MCFSFYDFFSFFLCVCEEGSWFKSKLQSALADWRLWRGLENLKPSYRFKHMEMPNGQVPPLPFSLSYL